jgi:hypothetical protein
LPVSALRFGTTHVDTGHVVESSSIFVAADGLPIIAYATSPIFSIDLQTEVIFIHCGDVRCASGNLTSTIQTAASTSTSASFRGASLAVGVDGRPIFNYSDSVSGAVNVVHCNDAACGQVTVVRR